MMVKRAMVGLSLAAALGACSSSGPSATPSPPESGIFGLTTGSAGPGGETAVTVRTLPDAGSIVTVVAQLDYDAARLSAVDCEIAAGAAGKALHWGVPQPGTLRAVVAGGLGELPGGDVFTCTFVVAGTASSGAVTVRAEGQVADTSFVDRPFSVEGAVAIQ